MLDEIETAALQPGESRFTGEPHWNADESNSAARRSKARGRHIITHPDDDGMITIVWGPGHVTTESLESYANVLGFNGMLGKWRKVIWSSEGVITGVDAREHPVTIKIHNSDDGVVPDEMKSMTLGERITAGKQRCLELYAQIGSIDQAAKESCGMSGGKLTWYLRHETSKYQDKQWHDEYLRLRKEKPWLNESRAKKAAAKKAAVRKPKRVAKPGKSQQFHFNTAATKAATA